MLGQAVKAPWLKENEMAKKLRGSTLTISTSTSTLPSSLLSAVDDGHSSNARTSLADSTTSRVSFTLDSTLDSVNKIEQTAEKYAQRAGFDEDTIPHIAMAVREAAVNAVLHGNAYDVNKHITASFETTSDDLVIRITDQGPGLDPSTLPDPLAPENILRGSGRGIFLIRAFMDEVNFRKLHPGTELTLIKHRTPAQSGT
jgi:serine/threonine-protein kinase RsbW